MKIFRLAGLLALNWVWASPLAAELATPFIIENRTGRAICEVYLAPAGTSDWTGWGGDGSCLEPGRKWSLKPAFSPPPGSLKDMMVIFEDGGSRGYFGLDLEHHTLAILGDLEAELLEWDPAAAR